MALTAEQVKNNLVNQILQNFPTADLETGSVLRDVMVDPQSVQMAALSEEIDYISYLNTFVQNADKISEEDLDEIGATYGVARSSGTLANGLITFQSTTRPTQNIQIGADDGSGGISVKTLLTESGNSYVFTTTETVYLKTDATYNPEHNCYEVTAHIQASSPGYEYNLGIGTIRVLDTGIANVTAVYNYTPTTGGSDRQSNVDYALSIQDAILGSSKNIESGIDSILKSITGVQEVKTLHPNSKEEPTKPGYSISYIRGSEESIISDYVISYVSTSAEYDFNKKPVTRIISVVATVNGEQKTLENGTDYYLYPTKNDHDYNSMMYGTTRSTDKIVFLRTANGTPDPNTDVIVSYAYNKLVETCQETLNERLNDYLILGTLLVAQAKPINIKFNTNIKLKYNYNTEFVKNEILTGISNYIQSLTLGQDLTQEELFTYITTTFSEYVSGVVYPFFIFCEEDKNASQSKISFTYGQYASIDENSINITFE